MGRKDKQGILTGPVLSQDRLQRHETGCIFQQMAEHHTLALLRAAKARQANAADAADLVQEAFERALRARPLVRDDGDLRAWLLTTLRHLLVDRRRSLAVRRAVPFDLVPVPAAEPEPIQLWRQIDMDVVQALLPRLSLPLRRAFELRLAGHSLRSIARQLGVAEGTAGGRLHRARLRLKELVFAYCPWACSEGDGQDPSGGLVPCAAVPSNDVYRMPVGPGAASPGARLTLGRKARTGVA